MLGTGVKHWRNILADLECIKKPAKILVIFITDDFYRPDWLFPEQQLACLAHRGDCAGQFWYPISDAMVPLAAERYALRSPQLGKSGMSRLLRYHLTASFTLFERFKRRTESDSQSLQDSLAIITELAARYPLKLIWVNEKSETRRRSHARSVCGIGLQHSTLRAALSPPTGFFSATAIRTRVATACSRPAWSASCAPGARS